MNTALTPDAIEVALHDCMPGVAFDRLSATQVMRLAEDMHAALTEPRPLSPDAITDEMIERARKAYRSAPWNTDAFRAGLVAALAVPPARPEGAEKIAAAIVDWDSRVFVRSLSDRDADELADHIAEEMNR